MISAMCPCCCDRCVELLAPALTRHHPDGSGAVLVDATLGAGGHAERFLTELPGLRLIGLDRDPDALDIARARLARFADRVTLVHTRYDGIDDALAESGYATTESVDAVLFDLGVSSMQLDRAERGFSYAQDAPLDMRMDPDVGADRGRHRQHLRRGRAGRHPAPLRRGAVRPPHRRADRRAGAHAPRSPRPASWWSCSTKRFRRRPGAPADIRPSGPSRRCASRSTASWTRCAARCPPRWTRCAVGGRIVVMAYQSLEDRIVKRVFADAVASRTPVDLPVELPGHEPQFRSLTRGAERADAAEIERNPRSAAVRLRAVQRVEHGREPQRQATGKGDAMKTKREAPKRKGGRIVGVDATVPRAPAGAADGRSRRRAAQPARKGTAPAARRGRQVRTADHARSPGRSNGRPGPRAPARPRREPRRGKPRRPRLFGPHCGSG